MTPQFVRYKNPTGDTVRADGVLPHPVPPGGEVDVPVAYCQKRPAQLEGKFLAPIVKQVAPQLVPVDAAAAKKLDVLPMVPPKVAPTQADFEAQGLAPGVAEVAAKQAAAAASAKRPPAKAPKADE